MTVNFVFFLCGCVILHMIICMIYDYRHFMNNVRYEKRHNEVCKGPEYEQFITELDCILNNRAIIYLEDYKDLKDGTSNTEF